MSFLPIIARELRVQSRKAATYWFRVSAALLGFAVGFLTLMTAAGNASPESTGKIFFWLLGGGAFALVMVDSLRTTSDTLSEERRDGTLVLLFLTNLRSYDIVLGKFAGATLNSYYALAAILPLFSIPLLLGGVTLGEVFRLNLLLITSLTTAAALGILVSSLRRNTLECYLITLLALLGLCSFPFLFENFTPRLTPILDVRPLSPIQGMLQLDDAHYILPACNFGITLLCQWGWTLLAITGACFFLMRRDAPGQIRRGSTPTGVDALDKPILNFRARSPHRKWLTQNPYYWLGRWHNLTQHWIWVGVGGAIVIILFSLLLQKQTFDVIPIVIVATVITHFSLSFWQTLTAVRLGHEFKKTGAAELALITPMAPQRIVTGLVSGVRYPCLPAAIILYGVEILIIGCSSLYIKDSSLGENIIAIGFLVVGMIASVMEILGAAWMGMYQGLYRTKMSTALARAVFWTQMTTFLTFCCCFALGPFISLIKTMIVAAWARDTLLFTFPKLVRQSAGFEPPTKFWKSGVGKPPALPSVIPKQ